MQALQLKAPPRRVLVICIRRLGDVLLSTALLRSLRAAWPQARIEVLVNAASAAALYGNRDVDALIVQPEKPTPRQTLAVAARILRRYDLAISTLYNDRPHVYALLAAGTRACIVPPPGMPGVRWKRWMSDAWCVLQLGRVHAVESYLALADVLGVPRVPQVVPPQPDDTDRLDALLGAGWRGQRRAVVHPAPMYRYKAWTVAGWSALVQHLDALGLQVCITGGPGADEARLVEQVLAGVPPPHRERVQVLQGKLAFAELTPLIQSARVFVGPDTSVTHLAAAAGVPTIALFGPSHPVAWGPWPRGWNDRRSPWQMRAALQQQGNVWLVQGEAECVPCLNEGCERHVNSRADCLEQLAPQRVIAVVEQALGAAAGMQRPWIPITPLASRADT